mmetsp:Transcript_9568/g.35074  ORF Transcript_9568/g.35074 Transcript_9568/m.35074 type:complete len:264 (-) Transcript_9568:797-1588(-)
MPLNIEWGLQETFETISVVTHDEKPMPPPRASPRYPQRVRRAKRARLRLVCNVPELQLVVRSLGPHPRGTVHSCGGSCSLVVIRQFQVPSRGLLPLRHSRGGGVERDVTAQVRLCSGKSALEAWCPHLRAAHQRGQLQRSQGTSEGGVRLRCRAHMWGRHLPQRLLVAHLAHLAPRDRPIAAKEVLQVSAARLTVLFHGLLVVLARHDLVEHGPRGERGQPQADVYGVLTLVQHAAGPRAMPLGVGLALRCAGPRIQRRRAHA